MAQSSNFIVKTFCNFITVVGRVDFVLTVEPDSPSAAHIGGDDRESDQAFVWPLVSRASNSSSVFLATVWCLPPLGSYRVSIFTPSCDTSTHPLQQLTVQLKPSVFSCCPIEYVGEEHLCSSQWMECIAAQPRSIMVTIFSPNKALATLDRLFYDGLFALPQSDDSPVVIVPNGVERFCIPLNGRQRWDHSKKMRHALKGFTLSIRTS